jgi:hypothetical protein
MAAARRRVKPSGGLLGRYTPEMATLICSLMAEGSSLRSICERDGRPDKSTVFRWLAVRKDFQDQYARAMYARADVYAEEIIEISDDGRNDTYEDEDGHETTNHDVIAQSRLRVDTRKWLMARMAPRKYGDRVTQVQAGDPENPVQTVTRVERVSCRRNRRKQTASKALATR